MRLHRILIFVCALTVSLTGVLLSIDQQSAALPAPPLELVSTSRATPAVWAGDYSPVAAVLHDRDVYAYTAAANAQAVADAEAAAEAQRARDARKRALDARIASHDTAAASKPEVPVAAGSIEEAIVAVFGSQRAVRIADCESSMDPGATNGEHRGLFQVAVRIHADRIAAMGYTADQMWQVGPNIAVAKAIYDDAGGWGPWQCKG